MNEEIQRQLAAVEQTDTRAPEMADGSGDQFRTIEFLVQDESIPEAFRKLFWAFSDKENEIANMSERDMRLAVMRFSIANCKYIYSRPEYEYSFDESFNITQLAHKLAVKLTRSRMGFERRQISGHETARKITATMPPKKGTGTLGKVFGRGKEQQV